MHHMNVHGCSHLAWLCRFRVGAHHLGTWPYLELLPDPYALNLGQLYSIALGLRMAGADHSNSRAIDHSRAIDQVVKVPKATKLG